MLPNPCLRLIDTRQTADSLSIVHADGIGIAAIRGRFVGFEGTAFRPWKQACASV